MYSNENVLGIEIDSVFYYAFEDETCPYSIFILLATKGKTNA